MTLQLYIDEHQSSPTPAGDISSHHLISIFKAIIHIITSIITFSID